jgi:hypothetical protein
LNFSTISKVPFHNPAARYDDAGVGGFELDLDGSHLATRGKLERQFVGAAGERVRAGHGE